MCHVQDNFLRFLHIDLYIMLDCMCVDMEHIYVETGFLFTGTGCSELQRMTAIQIKIQGQGSVKVCSPWVVQPFSLFDLLKCRMGKMHCFYY